MNDQSKDDFVKVAETKDIQRSQMKEVQIDGQDICIANVDGKYYAIGNVCTHEGGPLADGRLEGYEVECPWHQSKFDVRTGEVTSPPASESEPIYEIKVDGTSILVRKHPSAMEKEQQQQLQQQGPPSRPSSEYELSLLEKQKFEATDVMSFRFSKKEKQKPQQGIEADDDRQKNSFFDYTAGQYAFFDIGGVNNDSKGPIRHFTISSSPTEDFIMITTRIRDSPYKKRLASLEKGTIVKVRGPQGKFVLHEDYSKPAVLLSGGIGVTPFRSMIKYATDKQLPIKIVMFDSNRNQENTLFKKEFDEYVNINRNLKIVYTITEEEEEEKQGAQDTISSAPTRQQWTGERGRIDKDMLTKHLTDDEIRNSIFYTCGPPGMIKAMQDIIQNDLRIPKDRIKVEEFTGY
ncbi:MAG TPA: Rieske 2Fe-2S domain-containing protein [Nitrososphaeraceae archaeon]|nr:Rieske 2Fe-2S domain-containing protein [Nitrososphaeraceae archaeon]